jgi:tetratricopeptide (TPR) repeat protein
MGLVYFHRGEHRLAADFLEKVTRDGAAAQALIRSYLAMGWLHRAEGVAATSEALATEHADLRQARALVATLVQRRKAILAAAKPGTASEEICLQAASAVVCAEQAQRDARPASEVQKLLMPAFDRGVDLGPAYALRGLLGLEKGQLTRALADANRAVLLSPREARGYFVRGRVRLERGDKDALADLLRAAELSGRRDPAVLHWLAAALFQAGNHPEALTVQREALRLRPEDPELAEQLHEFERVKTRTSLPERGASAP